MRRTLLWRVRICFWSLLDSKKPNSRIHSYIFFKPMVIFVLRIRSLRTNLFEFEFLIRKILYMLGKKNIKSCQNSHVGFDMWCGNRVKCTLLLHYSLNPPTDTSSIYYKKTGIFFIMLSKFQIVVVILPFYICVFLANCLLRNIPHNSKRTKSTFTLSAFRNGKLISSFWWKIVRLELM